MITSWALVVGLLSGASGAPVTGHISFRGAPAARARVVFEPVERVASCEKTKFHALGACACAGPLQEDLIRKLAAGNGNPRPVADTTTDGSGRFSLSAEGKGPWILVATSADGSAAARLRVSGGAHDFPLAALRPFRVRFSGLTADARSWLLDLETGEVAALSAEGGDYLLPLAPLGHQVLVSGATGAFFRFDDVGGGELAGVQGLGRQTLELVGPRTIHLKVIEELKPVEGAEILVNEGTCPMTLRSDSAGNASFPARSATHFFSARRENSTSRVTLQGVDTFTLTLQPVANLELIAVTPTGAPAPGVMLDNCPQSPLDARGVGVCAGLAPGTQVLTIRPPWFLMSDGKLDSPPERRSSSWSSRRA